MMTMAAILHHMLAAEHKSRLVMAPASSKKYTAISQGERPLIVTPAKQLIDLEDSSDTRAKKKKLKQIPCSNGIPHNDLQSKGLSLPEEGVSHLHHRLNYICDHWHHKDCCGYIIDLDSVSLSLSLEENSCKLALLQDLLCFPLIEPGGEQLQTCIAARSSVRVGRVPQLLFSGGPSSIANIAHSNE
jgi:hypothetical protein